MPRDPDDLDEVLGQVESALDELEIVDGDERDALLTSLRGVLGSLGDLPLTTLEVRAVRLQPEAASPSVSLLEGGRADDDVVTGGRARPALRLADDAEGAPIGADSDFSAQFRIARPRARPTDTIPEPPGQICFPAKDETAHQPIFQGSRARTYRVRCLTGSLAVRVDEDVLPPLRAGQTVDVEGRRISVSAVASTPDAAEGRYIRLRS